MNIFDVNHPANLDAIQQYIGGYATPEAAVADTPSRGTDFLNSSYQRATGDAFADPFQDAETARSRALIQAATQGFGVTTGSRATGGWVSTSANPRATDAPHPVAVDPTAAAANSQPQMRGITPDLPNLMGLPTNTAAPVAEAVAGAIHPSSPVATLQQGGMSGLLNYDYRNAAGTLNPAGTLNGPMSTLEQRVRAAGVDPSNPIVKRIMANPDAAKSDGIANSNMLRDKSGKIIPAAALHSVASDPDFQMLASNPATAPQAEMLYKAFAGTNRDFRTDYQAHSELAAQQRGNVDEIIKGIKNPYVHPLTGEIYHTVEMKDPLNPAGGMVSQEVPLDDRQKMALQSRHGFQGVYGFDLPNTGGIQKPEGMDDEAHKATIALAQKLLGKNTRPSAQQAQAAYDQAHSQLYAKQQAGSSNVATRLSNLGPDIMGTLAQVEPTDIGAAAWNAATIAPNLTKAQFNLVPRGVNAALAMSGSNRRVPLIPNIPMMSGRHVSSQEIKTRSQVAELLAQMLQKGGAAFTSQ